MATHPESNSNEPFKPLYLRGNFAPVSDELTEHALPVVGQLPRELAGTYLRNGPNPKSGFSKGYMLGDGMLHGVCIADGKARWYRNRYLRTAAFTRTSDAAPLSDRISRLRGGGVSNTHVIEHAGRLLSLVECCLPLEVDSELATIGAFDFDGQVDTPMTAHPKRCPLTGELHFFGYQHSPPYLTYYIADADGRVVRRQEVDIGGPSFLHDFAITEHHALFFDTPLRMVADWAGLVGFAAMPFQWSDAHKARIGVVPRGGGAARWFEVAPSHLGHTVNAFEQGGRIVMEGVRYAHRPEARYAQFSGAPPLYHRWELELASGRVHEQPLDDQPVELPRVDERRVGRPHRYAYAVELQALVDAAIAGSRLRRYDTTTGESVVHDFGPLQVPGECVFVPAGADAAEDSGWLLSFVYDGERDRSDLVVLDARAFAAPPVARIRLPGRVPFGFHGSWVPAGRP